MKINGQHYRTIWLADDSINVNVIDQTKLPFTFETTTLKSYQDAAVAIRDMVVRGAPLIGATAAYGIALAMRTDPSDSYLAAATEHLRAARPTAVNLGWALDQMNDHLRTLASADRSKAAYAKASEICDSDVEICDAIGGHGLSIIKNRWEALGKPNPFNVLTHCNAGWLACVDWGTALAPIYKAHDRGIPVHVWVDETRPRNQGAALTAFELSAHGVPHTVITDNAGGHLMQRGLVQMVIVGSDRTTHTGDVCNKIGTYLKALAARDNDIPFYVALPSTTIDWSLREGQGIPIEERDAREVTHISGKLASGEGAPVQIVPDGSPALNPAFDITPANLVSGLITERGECEANESALRQLFPEHARGADREHQ